MIIGDPRVIAIHIEQMYVYEMSPYGILNLIIEDEFIPGKGTDIYLYSLDYLRDDLEKGLKRGVPDIGNVPIESIDFEADELENLIFMIGHDLTSDYGVLFCLGFDGEEERFFYGRYDRENDRYNAKDFKELRLPKGTVENLFRSAPKITDLVTEKIDGAIITTLKRKKGAAK